MSDPNGNQDVPACANCAAMAARVEALAGQVERLLRRIEQLTAQLEAARRSGKRQAAPFSKGEPRGQPGRPGRKAGPEHGVHVHRAVPDTEPDEVIAVASPERCPSCGGAVHEISVEHQHQADLPRRPIHRRFDLHVGRCGRCGLRVQPRHPLQTSAALGAAAAQVGPAAQAAMVELHKTCGLSYGKLGRVFKTLFGIGITRGGACRVVLRAARRCQPTYQAIVDRMPKATIVTPDETGWRIGGLGAWLHVFAGVDLTCYVIDAGRGYEVARRILGDPFRGLLIHDGWRPYDRFLEAAHQTCLAHLIRRCRELIEAARGLPGAAARFPRQIKTLLQQSLVLRDRFVNEQISPHGLASGRGRLEHRLDRLLTWTRSHPDNERLANHLALHRQQIFTFLHEPWLGRAGAEATNWRAEQALRPAVVNRKVWGGNRTRRGADAQQTLLSVLRTWEQRGLGIIESLVQVLCNTHASPFLPAGP